MNMLRSISGLALASAIAAAAASAAAGGPTTLADSVRAANELQQASMLFTSNKEWSKEVAVLTAGIETLESALKIVERDRITTTLAALYVERGISHREAEDSLSALERSISDFEQALTLQPDDANIKQRVAIAHNARGCQANGYQAIRDFDRAIEMDDSNGLYYANRGIEHLNQNNLDKAIDDLTAACKRDPKPDYIKLLAGTFNGKGMALVKSIENRFTRPSRWELQTVLEYFETAAELDPGTSTYRENYNYLRGIMQNYR